MIDIIGKMDEQTFALIYFPHGLFFFAMGVSIIAQHRKSNPFRFANDLWIMGIFAIIHAFAEWFDILIVLRATSFDAETLFWVKLISGTAESLSYAVLFVFGLRLLIQGRSWVPWVIPTGIFAAWVALVIIGLRTYQDPRETLTVAQVLSHYMLLIPSVLVAAWALLKQAGSEAAADLPQGVRTAVRALAWIFVLVAFVNGLFVKPGPFVPANTINTETFQAVTGIDVQWVRASSVRP